MIRARNSRQVLVIEHDALIDDADVYGAAVGIAILPRGHRPDAVSIRMPAALGRRAAQLLIPHSLSAVAYGSLDIVSRV